MIKEVLLYMGIAFAGSLGLIIMSKFIMPIFMKKPADYYYVKEEDEERFFVEPIVKEDERIEEEKLALEREAAERAEAERAEAERIAAEEAAARAEEERLKELRAGLKKPSMRMKKDELIALAGEYEVVLPDKVTKAQIIELIEQVR